MNTTMRVVDHGLGGPPEIMKVISDVPLPVLKAHEVLIEVHATGINRPDVFQRSGSYPPPLGASPYLGLEVAGVVVARGPDVTQWQIGDQVCALTPGGAYAEYCATPAAHCLRIPKGLTMVQAAAIPETYFTVWSNLFDMGHLKSNETILIHGGSSGIGVTAIQFAKAFGAKVITTVGSSKKAERCLELGADVAIEYKDQDYEEVILKLTNKVGVDVILDIVGGPYIQKNINCLAFDGRLLQVAFLKGSKAQLDVNAIMRKRLTYTGATMRPRSDEQKAAIAKQLEKNIWPLMDQGQCLPVIDTVFTLDEVVAAHQLMESSVHIGKIVLAIK